MLKIITPIIFKSYTEDLIQKLLAETVNYGDMETDILKQYRDFIKDKQRVRVNVK